MSSRNQSRAGSSLEGISSAPGFANPRSALDVSMGWTAFNILAPLHVMIQTLKRTANSPPGIPAFLPSPCQARSKATQSACRSEELIRMHCFGGNEREESSSPPGNSPDACGDVSDGLSSSLHFINFLLSDA